MLRFSEKGRRASFKRRDSNGRKEEKRSLRGTERDARAYRCRHGSMHLFFGKLGAESLPSKIRGRDLLEMEREERGGPTHPG